MRKTYEKPSKGNPHRISIRQHILSKKVIENFCDSTGSVEVKTLFNGKVYRAKPDNPIFCANRVWDQRAENGWMKSIEDNFHNLLNFPLKISNNFDQKLISQYFALWSVRSHYNKEPMQDAQLNGILPDSLTSDKQEIIESKHANFVDNNGKVESRFVVSFSAQRDYDIIMQSLREIKWKLLVSRSKPFVVPKHCSSILLLPISPCFLFAGNLNSGYVNANDVLQINRTIISEERELIFSSELTLSGIL